MPVAGEDIVQPNETDEASSVAADTVAEPTPADTAQPLEQDNTQDNPPANSPDVIPPNTTSAPLPTKPLHIHYVRFVLSGLFAGVAIAATVFALATALATRGSLGILRVADVTITKKLTPAELESQLQEKLSAVRITVAGEGREPVSYPLNDAGIAYDIPRTVQDALELKSAGTVWQRLQWWHKDTMQPIFSVDQAKLKEFVANNTVIPETAPINATLTTEAGQVVTTPDQSGNGVAVQAAEESITAAAQQGTSATLTLVPQDIPAAVRLADIEPIKKQIEQALSQPIEFDIIGKTFIPARETVADWVTPITAEATKANLEYDSGKIQTYLEQISKKFVSLPKSEISMVNQDGTTTVLVPGANGTDIANKLEIAAGVAADLAKATPHRYALLITDAQYTKVLAQEYDKWLEVNLTTKILTAYEKSNPVKTIKVSAGAPATPTSLGMYKIYAKVRIQDMRGLNADGSSYFQPDVEWVSYFNQGQAVHGNYWRPTWWFGVNNSSHGCVGMLNVDAKWVYEWAPVGTPIINHF